MSEVATGACAEISERGDWTTFHIDTGGKYPVKLASKKSEIIELGRAASRNGGEFDWTYNEVESDRINEHTGKPFINRYLEGVEPAGSAPQSDSPATRATPDTGARAQAQKASGEMSKEEWARKDSAIHKMACIKTAADALKHTLPSEPSSDDLTNFLSRVSILALAWHRSVLAERDDPTGEDVPF